MQISAQSHPQFQGFFGDEDAQPKESAATYVTFEIGGQLLAADVIYVREILDIVPISPLPNAAVEIMGMIDVRGEGVAVIDLQHRLQLRAASTGGPAGGQASGTLGQTQKIIILEMPGAGDHDARAIGIIADLVRSVVEIAPSRIEPVPATLGTWRSDMMTGVARWEGALVYMLALQHLRCAPQGAANGGGGMGLDG